MLNQAVKRHRERFPADFTFRLSRDEALAIAASRSQSVTLKLGENIKYLPYVFTEHGAIMAANVLNSRHAVRMSVYVVRACIRLRQTIELQKDVRIKLDELERAGGFFRSCQSIGDSSRVILGDLPGSSAPGLATVTGL